MKRRDPQTPAEWQEAANAAEACLLIHSARCYGLIAGGPKVDVIRCERILRRARLWDVQPLKAGVEAVLAEFVGAPVKLQE